jgi:hypothetical protein
MEDSNKMKAQPKDASQDKGRVIDLTPEMETVAGARAKIIELTQTFEIPSDRSAPSPERVAAPERVTFPPAETAAAPEAPQPPVEDDAPNIEADVDAAFEAMKHDDPPLPSDDTTVALSRIAEPDPLTPATTTEPELELTIDELAADEPWVEGPGSASDDAAGPVGAGRADHPLDLTDVVRPIDMRTKAESAAGIRSGGAKTNPEVEPSDFAAPDGQEETIELTDVVEPMDEDRRSESSDASNMDEAEEDILELTDVVEGDDTADAQDEEEVIDLIDIVPAGEPAGAAEQEQDEVIELTDIVDPSELAIIQEEEKEEVIDLTDIAPSEASDTDAEQAQDEVIELTDAVDPDGPAAGHPAEAIELTDIGRPDDREEQAPPLADLEDRTGEAAIELIDRIDGDAAFAAPEPLSPASPQELDDRVIRLDNVLDHLRENRNKLDRDIALGVEEELFNATTPMDDQERQPVSSPSFVADQEVERAVEKILTTKYAQTIEEIIAKVVERVVTREIESIKRDLMEGED